MNSNNKHRGKLRYLGRCIAMGLCSSVVIGHANANVIFTEYVEGSSNNKALEITNFGNNSIDLSTVSIALTANGKKLDEVTPLTLSGTLAAGSSYVLYNNGASDELKALGDIASTATYFNGDDALTLMVNGTIVDSIGQVGTDPGSSWGSGNTSTKDKTLRRKIGIESGDITIDDAFDPANEWIGFAKNTFDGLGCSGITACGGDGNIPSEISGEPKGIVNATDTYVFTPTVTNLDDDTLVFAIENKPSWASFDTTTGKLSGTPTAADMGIYDNIVITVSDGTVTNALNGFSILVRAAGTNDAPLISGSPNTSVQATRNYAFTPDVTDLENDSLVFSITNKPSWATFDTASGQLAGTPAESDTGNNENIIISVSDGFNAPVSLPAFSITVTDKPGSNYDYNTYYASAIGKVGAELENALSLVARQGQQRMTYSQVWDALKYTDEDPDNSNNVLLFYTGKSQSKDTNGGGTTDWNREHSWPKSHGFPSENQYGYTDIHHLRPTNVKVNSTRSSKDYDDGGNPVDGAPGNFTDSDSFEPRDAVKGDAARMMFYMAVRYDGTDGSMPDLELVNNISASSSPTLGVLCNLMDWHREDTVDKLELDRHQRIVEQQGNRNPFVDNPEFAEILFGETCPKLGDVAPVIGGQPELIVGTGRQYSFTPTASDQNKDTLTFSIVNKPSWATFDTQTGHLSGTPAVADIAIYEHIQISVTDGTSTVSLPSFNIEVVDSSSIKNPPTITGTPSTSAIVGIAYRFKPEANDEDNDTLTFSITNKPSWATFNTQNGELSGTPSSQDIGVTNNIVIGVTDGNTDSVNLPEFSIQVSEQVETSKVIFTEYIEGSSSNKAVEITNFTGATLDLSRVTITLADNGKPLSTEGLRTQTLSGELKHGETHVIANSSANDEIKSRQDSTSTITYFNGDDALVLTVDGQIADVFGQVGTDPGSAWGSGNTSTKDKTLRRKEGITSGDTTLDDGFDPSVEWEGFEKNTADGLGCSGVLACGTDGGTPPPQVEIGVCNDPATLISAIQGNGTASPLVDQSVVIEGVVVAAFQDAGQHGGFFIQEEDQHADSDSATSEGIFVADTNTKVTVGEQVRVLGNVVEKYDLTQINAVTNTLSCATNVLTQVTPTQVNLPFTAGFDQESLEGMWVSMPQKLHVTLSHNFTKYGEIYLSQGMRMQPTNKYPKDDPRRSALADLNARNSLLVDDNSTQSNPEEISYYPGFSADSPLRSGDQVSNMSGVIHYTYGNYKLIPTSLPSFEPSNTRRTRPYERKSEQHIRVASFNVMNYFVNFNSRGANNEKEFTRQRSKVIRAIVASDADVVGLMEIENNGYGDSSAIKNLIDGLNERDDVNDWAFINPQLEQVGTDAVTVGIIYRANRVVPQGSAHVITEAPFDEATRAHRPPMLQTFKPINGGKGIRVVVNHFRSKGGSCGADMDDTVEGACNGQRILAAKTVVAALTQTNVESSESTNSPVYAILGDFNAYTHEAPMLEFYKAGFTNISIEKGVGDNYSYYFSGVAGSLDHMLTANDSMERIVQSMHWHINADEAAGLDYNTEGKSEDQQSKWFSDSPYRSSDHDPVVTDFDLAINVLPDNQAPVANDDTADAVQGERISIDVLANDTDADSDPLIINAATLISGEGDVSYSDAQVSFTPSANFVGQATISYTIADGNGETASATISVNVIAKNRAPIAIDDTANTLEDHSVTVSVLSNDSDENTASLKVTNATLTSGLGQVAYSDSSITYSPAENFNGTAQITYEISDDAGLSASAHVAITIAPQNDAPTAVNDSAIVSAKLQANINVLANDSDIDGDTLHITSADANIGNVEISGNVLQYQAPALNTGHATISYTISDGTDTAQATVNVQISTANLAPVAKDDFVQLAEGQSSATITVLDNDSDPDGDTLSLVAVNTDAGNAVIEGNQIVFSSNDTFNGVAQVRYAISDGFGGRAEAVLELRQEQPFAPVITVPADLTVNATGLLTKVDLGVATAVDSNDESIAVELLGNNFLPSGANKVYWQACSTDNVCEKVAQLVNVRPMVSLPSPSQVVVEGQTATVPVVLSGEHFTYPLTIDYTVSGTAGEEDYASVLGQITIESGTQGHISIETVLDDVNDADETVVITLDTSELNANAEQRHEITIVESNIAPTLTLNAIQQDEVRSIVVAEQGPITITADVIDQNSTDTHTIEWTAPTDLSNESTDPTQFSIDASTLSAGVYQISAKVTDNAGLFDIQSVIFKVVLEQPALDMNADSDGDLINNAQEGFGDEDADGIPNYLDPIDAQCNILPSSGNNWDSGLIEVEAGVCMSLGSLSLGSNKNAASLNADEAAQTGLISADDGMENRGGIFDFVVDVPSGMDSVKIVLPQQAAIPANAQYRKHLPNQGWVTLSAQNGNALHSAIGQHGYCPSINDSSWQEGLVEGAWCVRLTLVDGGEYDADGIKNGKIVDPGGVSVVQSDNVAPVAVDDTLEVTFNQSVMLEVLANDTDADNDTLYIVNATAVHGVVSINADSSLQYISALDFVGIDTIEYTLSDGQGGTSTATVVVRVVAQAQLQNQPPVTMNDVAEVFNNDTVTVDVTNNDSDPEGGKLTLISATADSGEVTFTDSAITFKPTLNSEGKVTINYIVADEQGANASGILVVAVKVPTKETDIIERVETRTVRTSSGSMPVFLLLLVLPALVRRRR
ncbi:ExeM/NucH family extracellular endonuclease [Pseudoalteromonas sp. Of7M-16]|uniref:ExeM/NucH family extracellular endonuclease n=1 Tax=Pseudoalteromonas sp. Of7M-16 TaxID=2917756 RepID=UPI001EF4EE0B|nr:ExeM/NucH family extracellular endonuclease [Pseudoalteromonas sp. Of7M-16]MCG7550151.1 ExeM/NucH family extracellular endonuclease [Pseudoalteromonas sp. Of7M-16]